MRQSASRRPSWKRRQQQRKAAEAAAAKVLAEKQAADAENKKVAALSPAPTSSPAPGDLAKTVQLELLRVGCMSAWADSEWGRTAQRSLTLFNKYAGTKFDAKLASTDALDALKAKPTRVCPLVCDHGFKADGDQCVKVTCRAGYRVNDDNDCEETPEKKPPATARDEPRKRDQGRKDAESAAPKSQASGQMICNNAGCSPVPKGCRLEFRKNTYGSAADNNVVYP